MPPKKLFFVYFVYTCEQNNAIMAIYELEKIKRPTKKERKTALESYDALTSMLEKLKDDNPEIEIDETRERIRIPKQALIMLAEILEATSNGNPVSIVPIATEMTTQAAADLLGCSRPHIVKLLENGAIPFTKIGKHRRIKFEDVVNYKSKQKRDREDAIIKIMQADEADGLYDS